MWAAAIPCGLVLAVVLLNEWLNSPLNFLLYVLVLFVVPIHIARGWGAWLGAAILDPSATQGAGVAALRGAAVAGASFVTYLFALSLCFGSFSSSPVENALNLFILLMVGGTILVGWLVVAVGALAGGLLYGKAGGGTPPAE
ncbi:MAG: hypothetical protein JOZ96_13955 [Acidobacteria bacterium]|nr:hypothetical protein [Acidobacteriota bacterium]